MGHEYLILLPEIVLLIAALVVLGADPFLRPGPRTGLYAITLGGVVAAGLALIPGAGIEGQFWGGMISADKFSVVMRAMLLGVAALVLLYSPGFIRRFQVPEAEYYGLLLFATLGGMLMAGSRDLLTVYLGVELSSISAYVLAGLMRKDAQSNEAALKYFLNGALASAILLFGLSLVYGLVGTTHLDVIAELLRQVGLATSAGQLPLGPAYLAAVAVALGLLIVGFGIKLAVAPLHFWAPDAYHGAPTPVTGFFSVGPKVGVLAALARTFTLGVLPHMPGWVPVIASIALISMTVGNLAALRQTNVKRMMAYSSVAQAGYLLVGIAALGGGVQGLIYYLLAYIFMNLGVFAIVTALDAGGHGAELDSYRGLAQRSPAAAWALVVCFVSLIGLPPTAGFLGKFLLFTSAVGSGLLWLAVAMALNSVISVGYYYGVVRRMFLESNPDAAPVQIGTGPAIAAAVGAVGTVLFGIMVNPALDWTYAASQIANMLK